MRRIRGWRWDWNKTLPIADLKNGNLEWAVNPARQLEIGQSEIRQMKKRAKTFTISAVAEQFELHPQTLRLYEREGLLKPSRSEGNTRLYTDTDLERLEIILSLTRDLGVNLAGVEIILNMREKMDAMQREFERFFDYLQTHAEEFSHFTEPPPEAGALVPITRASAIRRRATARRPGS
jgi:MerR family transcriptional regulator/heat shock protein HspR